MRRVLPWAILLGIVVATSAAFAGPKVIPVADRKFDHAAHEKLAASSSDPRKRVAACTTCHKMDPKGIRVNAKEHTNRCVGCHTDPATCTGEMKTAGPTNPQNRCLTCHERTLDKQGVPVCGPKVVLTPRPASNTFEAKYSHGKHIGFGAAVEKDCARCHGAQAPAGANTSIVGVHAACVDCHNGPNGRSKLQFNDCAGCHGPPKGKSGGPSGDPFRLAQFDHRAHHARTNNQAACTACHAMTANSGSDLPRPAMNSCLQKCHDGSGSNGKAFSAVGTKCVACHKGATGQAPPNRTDLAFSHAAHAGRKVNIAQCADCHSVEADGNLQPPNAGKNHTPCSNSGCHQTEFMSRTTKICGICHDASVPWQKTIARAPLIAKPEWFENMNHTSHLAKKGTTNAACADCHGDQMGTKKKPKGHAPCAECHGKVQTAFAMTQCGTCHVQDKPTRAPVSQWSVAVTFKHDKHAMDPRSKKATACIECHAGIQQATTLAAVKLPVMQTCDGCHNGKQSFKTTGFECARCHTPTGAPAAATPSAQSAFTPTSEAMLAP